MNHYHWGTLVVQVIARTCQSHIRLAKGECIATRTQTIKYSSEQNISQESGSMKWWLSISVDCPFFHFVLKPSFICLLVRISV